MFSCTQDGDREISDAALKSLNSHAEEESRVCVLLVRLADGQMRSKFNLHSLERSGQQLINVFVVTGLWSY